MDFYAIIVFLSVYFIRPHDWLPGFAGFAIVKPIMLVAIVGMFVRPRGFEPRDLLGTPLDVMMGVYYGYLIWCAEAPYDTFKAALPLFAFYVTTRQALSSTKRLTTYLMVWTICLLVISGMAVASKYGFDITGAKEITERAKDRLALNTWLHNNPNALGHSVIVGIPLVYFLMFWRRPFGLRAAAVPLMALLAGCAYYTESKGAFVAGFVTVVASMMFGRGKIFQVVILAGALTVGTGVVTQLPRMEGLSSRRSDEGMIGRVMAWELARTASRASLYGDGWKKFEPVVAWYGLTVHTATHSSYVKIGADLGFPGLFIYVGILYLCLRVLFQARTIDDDTERIRRLLFTIVFSYCVSNWMIDRAYHTEFFLMAGATGAFHMLLQRKKAGESEEEEAEQAVGAEKGIHAFYTPRPALPGPSVVLTKRSLPWETLGGSPSAGLLGGAPDLAGAGSRDEEQEEGRDDEGRPLAGWITWRKLGIIDLILMYGAFRATVFVWDYVIVNF